MWLCRHKVNSPKIIHLLSYFKHIYIIWVYKSSIISTTVQLNWKWEMLQVVLGFRHAMLRCFYLVAMFLPYLCLSISILLHVNTEITCKSMFNKITKISHPYLSGFTHCEQWTYYEKVWNTVSCNVTSDIISFTLTEMSHSQLELIQWRFLSKKSRQWQWRIQEYLGSGGGELEESKYTLWQRYVQIV